MAMGLLGYAVAGAGEGLGQGIAATGFEAMKQAMEQNRQAALLQMREEMDIAKEKRGQDIKIADETRHEETAKRLRETEGTPENIALQGSQIALRKARDAEADAQFQRTGKVKFSDGSEIATTPEGAVERRDSSGNVISSYKDKDSYAREQLGLIGRAGLAKTEADTKLHEAQAGREGAYGRLLDRSAGRGTGGGKSDANSYRMMESDKIEYQENAKDIRDIRKDATMDPAEKDRRIGELQLKNERIMFRIARNGDMRPTEDDINELKDNYANGNASVIARFNRVFGNGEAERILEKVTYPGMIKTDGRPGNKDQQAEASEPDTQKPRGALARFKQAAEEAERVRKERAKRYQPK